MDYGQIFTRAWNICWNNKWLFLLGFLAALSTGNSSNNFNYTFGGEDFPLGPGGTLPPNLQQNIETAVAAAVPLLIGLACFGIILGIAIWLLRLTSQAGLIRAANEADAGLKITLRKAFSDGFRYLPRFVAINLLFFVPVILLGIISVVVFAFTFAGSIVAMFAGNGAETEAFASAVGLGALCACLLICLTIPLYIVIAILYPFAQRAIVMEEQGVFASIGRAWRMFRANLGETLVLILLYVGIGIVFGVIVAIVIVPLGLLLSLPSLGGLFLTGSFDVGSLVFSAFGLFVLAIISALLVAVWTAFRSVSFTLAYAQFAARTPLK
jgi:hypothetical protein